MTNRHPQRPDDAYLAELDAQGFDGHLAADTIREAWAHIDRLERDLVEAYEDDTARRAELLPVALDAGFDARGWFVYSLFEKDAEVPFYIGMSGNVLSRLGIHATAPEKRKRLHRVTLIRCPSAHEARITERSMIEKYRPEMNVVFLRVGVA
jgi:hypothetical protein